MHRTWKVPNGAQLSTHRSYDGGEKPTNANHCKDYIVQSMGKIMGMADRGPRPVLIL